WRFIFAVPMMWALVYRGRRAAATKRPSDAPIRPMLAVGIVISAAVLAAFFALERLPGSTYIALFYSYPAMVVVLSALMGERIRPVAWLALAMALTGVVLTVPDLMLGAGIDSFGVALALLNAAIVAVYYMLAKRTLAGVADVSGASAWMMVGTLAVLLLLIPVRGLQMPQNALSLLLLLGIAALGTVLPIFAINLAIQRIGAAQTSLISTVEPILSMVVSMLILAEVIQTIQWLGAALIIGSVIVLQLRPRNPIDTSIVHEAG
ncbi:MAG: DMT family transporter, partial [Chloroflexota bacterium]|nr:DMT family transporter [Chloroflexota bacterium]